LILFISGELGEGRRVVENVLDETQVCHYICIELAAVVRRNDARALLPAVLKLQAKVAERRRPGSPMTLNMPHSSRRW
jgi:hypothetical protein